MRQTVLAFFILFLHIKHKTWREIPSYYRTLGFVMFVNSFYYYICKRYLLWEFPIRTMNWRLLRALHLFYITPSLILLFLTSFPPSMIGRIIHIFKWVISSTFAEYVGLKMKMIKYRHGWSLSWSGLFFLEMYLFSYLHSKKSLPAWILTFLSTLFFVYKFNIPLKKMKKRMSKGPLLFWWTAKQT